MPARRRILSETELERALVDGLSHGEIATRFKCAPRTVRNRISEARAKHGPGWPVRAKPTKPAPPPPPKIPDDPAPEYLERLARRRLAAESEHAAEARDRIAASKALLQHPPAPDRPATPIPRETLIEDLRRAILDRPPPTAPARLSLVTGTPTGTDPPD